MAGDRDERLDWAHLPHGVEPESLWSCLHDAKLRGTRSDLAGGTLVLVFESVHLREHLGLPDDWRFELHFAGVRSARATGWVRPEPPHLNGLGSEEQSRLTNQHFQTGREESMTWSQFERMLDNAALDILDADLACGPNVVAMRFGGMLDGDQWHQLIVQAGELSVRRSDDLPSSLDELQGLGEAYWTAFSQRQPPE
jgi:hypothetical protein